MVVQHHFATARKAMIDRVLPLPRNVCDTCGRLVCENELRDSCIIVGHEHAAFCRQHALDYVARFPERTPEELSLIQIGRKVFSRATETRQPGKTDDDRRRLFKARAESKKAHSTRKPKLLELWARAVAKSS